MVRAALAMLFSTITAAGLLLGIVVLSSFIPEQFFIDNLIDPRQLEKGPKAISFMIEDLFNLTFGIVMLSVGVAWFCSLVWFLRAGFTRIELPGYAARYRASWSAIPAVCGPLMALYVGYTTTNATYASILRLDMQWVLPVVSLPTCWFFYWLLTAMWTPALKAPAVILSGPMRRLLFLRAL